MRAKFILEKFIEDSDPIQDMGIGVIDVKTDVKFLKKLPLDTLEELYKRVHHQQKANVIVDGYPFDEIHQYMKSRINNLTVKALKYKRAIQRRDEVRSSDIKAGDLIKCEHKGKWWFGYPEFSARGIIKTDGNARILVKTLTGTMKIPLSYAEKATPKEQKEFDKQYFTAKKQQLETNMTIFKEWSPARYEKAVEDYKEFMKIFKKKNLS